MDNVTLRRGLAYYQLGAGVGGLWLFLHGPGLHGPALVRVLLALAFTAYSALLIAAGILVGRGRLLGRHLSVYAQWLQVPYLVTGTVTYVCYVPACVVLELKGGWLGLEAAIGGQVSFYLSRPTATTSFGLNLLPLVLLFLLTRRSLHWRPEPATKLAA